MINKNDLRKAAHELNLKGAVIEKVKLINDKFSLGDKLTIMYNGSVNLDNDENALSRVESEHIATAYNLGFLYHTPVKFKTYLRDDIIAGSEVSVGLQLNSTDSIAYREYVKDDKVGVKKIGYKEPTRETCNLISFEVKLFTAPALKNENIYESSDSSFKTSVAVPKDDLIAGVYLYMIQCIDVSLPILILSKNEMGEDELKDIAFKGNIKSDIYNSYFHSYEKTVHQTYEKLAYGEPYNGCFDLQFEENIENNIYSTNDGLSAVKENDKVLVYLNGYEIGESKESDDINNINFVKRVKDIDIFNPHYKVSDKFTVSEITAKYPLLYNILYTLPKSNDTIIEKISEDDLKDTEFSEVYRVDWCTEDGGEIKIVIDINGIRFQAYMSVDDTKELYFIYTTANMLEIGFADEDGVKCNYSRTAFRVINYSRDASLISFKPNYYINIDHSNNIVNTNLPLSGKFTKYNMFGIPSDF